MKLSHLVENVRAEANSVPGLPLFRGLPKALGKKGPVRVAIRTDRRPKNTAVCESILFNVMFERISGYPDIRKRALFCSSHIDTALHYADFKWSRVIRVQPLRNATLAFCPGVEDSIDVCEDLVGVMLGVEGGDALYNALTGISSSEYQSTPSSQLYDRALEQAPAAASAMDEVFGKYKGLYYVGGVTENIPDDVEVMVFGAPYYYAARVNDDQQAGRSEGGTLSNEFGQWDELD